MNHHPPFQQLVLRLGILCALLLVVGYGLFEGRRLIEGPEITIDSPRNGAALSGPAVHITGTAQNVAFFSINGRQAFVDEHGRFDVTVAPPPGYTVFTVSGTDRFGRARTRSVSITIDNFCAATA